MRESQYVGSVLEPRRGGRRVARAKRAFASEPPVQEAFGRAQKPRFRKAASPRLVQTNDQRPTTNLLTPS
jgi:hypothetical protein